MFGTESSFDFGSLSGTSAAGSTAGPAPPTSSSGAAPAGNAKSGAAAPEAHDWDALFAGLDDAATTPTAASSGGASGNAAANATAAGGGAGAGAESRPSAPGRALTEEGEHDDPILKNLTGMGYSRKEALNALEKYDYNLERVSTATTAAAAAVDHTLAAGGVGREKWGGGVRVRKMGF